MSTLYVVATPIGNLEDITYRAVRVLREVAWIACEDTRETRKLLDHFEIRTPLISYHDHNELERAKELGARLQAGDSGALVSDAGMPLVSDPGYRLVRAAIEAGVAVHPIPGRHRFHFGPGRFRAAHRFVLLPRFSAGEIRPARAPAGVAVQ